MGIHPHNSAETTIDTISIIENYLELKERLRGQGHIFTSETDTEIIAHLIEERPPQSDLADERWATEHERDPCRDPRPARSEGASSGRDQQGKESGEAEDQHAELG